MTNEVLKYYRIAGDVYAFNADGSQDDQIPQDAEMLSAPDVAKLFQSELTEADYAAAVQAHLDAAARARSYDSGTNLASYATSTNPVWAAEAQEFVAWRDAVWAFVYALRADPPVGGDKSVEALIALLPQPEWPAP